MPKDMEAAVVHRGAKCGLRPLPMGSGSPVCSERMVVLSDDEHLETGGATAIHQGRVGRLCSSPVTGMLEIR